MEEIGSEPQNKILIFVETKRKADDLTRLMRRDGYPAMCIHGDKQQKERDWVLGEFKHGSTTILVATDVAARGLDVDDVKFVINYDYPSNSEDYIHRYGDPMIDRSSDYGKQILDKRALGWVWLKTMGY